MSAASRCGRGVSQPDGPLFQPDPIVFPVSEGWAAGTIAEPVRRVVVLFYLEDRTCEEVGELLSMPTGTIEPCCITDARAHSWRVVGAINGATKDSVTRKASMPARPLASKKPDASAASRPD